MLRVKRRVSAAKERANERERRYNRDDIEQPFDNLGRKNPRYVKLYGDSIYSKIEKYK